MSNYDLKRAALRKANFVRRLLGLPPVDHLYKGDKGEPRSCPITNTIYDDDLSHGEVFVETDGREIHVEDFRNSAGEYKEYIVGIAQHSQARQFISQFDNGGFPELIKQPFDWVQNKDSE
jgi:hypothetical protein